MSSQKADLAISSGAYTHIWHFSGLQASHLTSLSHDGVVNTSRWNQNNRVVVTAGASGQLALNYVTGTVMGVLPPQQDSSLPVVNTVCFSKGSKFLATGCATGEIKVWNLKRQVQYCPCSFLQLDVCYAVRTYCAVFYAPCLGTDGLPSFYYFCAKRETLCLDVKAMHHSPQTGMQALVCLQNVRSSIKDHNKAVTSIHCSPDDKHFASARYPSPSSHAFSSVWLPAHACAAIVSPFHNTSQLVLVA